MLGLVIGAVVVLVVTVPMLVCDLARNHHECEVPHDESLVDELESLYQAIKARAASR